MVEITVKRNNREMSFGVKVDELSKIATDGAEYHNVITGIREYIIRSIMNFITKELLITVLELEDDYVHHKENS